MSVIFLCCEGVMRDLGKKWVVGGHSVIDEF